MPDGATGPPEDASARPDTAADPHDWLALTWAALPSRSRQVLTRRVQGQTLDAIGAALTPSLTRERVRQVASDANDALLSALSHDAPGLRSELEVASAIHPIRTAHAREIIGTTSIEACEALLVALGHRNPRGWAAPVRDYWTLDPAALRAGLADLVELAPLTQQEMTRAASEIRLPPDPLLPALLDDVDKLSRHALGWVRRARVTRDLAYLWLRGEGEPRSAADVAQAIGSTTQAARENMRRDPAFAQLRPEGTWALTDWRSAGTENRYSSALDVVIETLRELGPLEVSQLRAEVQRRYPVTDWRVSQCLSSNAIGRLSDGRWDLVERGAIPVEDTEPAQPDNIRCVGSVVGITLPVNHDLLRGSGLGVSRWLTWRLGLRTAPATRQFDLADDVGAVRVTRTISNSQVSSLRGVALRLDVAQGCELALLLHLDDDTASIRHTCAADACPARPTH